MQQGYRSVQRPLFAVGKRARPGKALKHLQGTVFSAEALSRPARPAFLLPFCCRRTPLVGSRCGQLLWFLSFSSLLASAGSEAFVAGRSLWTASALKAMRSRYLSTLGLLSSGAVGVVVSHPLRMREGLGSIPGLSMPMCACVCHSLPLPGLSSLWVCCASCQDRLVRRGRVPNVTFESYIESRKLSVPRARPARTASRPARLEAAAASANQRSAPAACSAAAGCLTSRLSPICSKAIGPSSGLFSLWANERGLEKRSSTCRAQFSALKLCHGPLVRPFCFLSAAGALLWLVLAVGKGVRARPFGL